GERWLAVLKPVSNFAGSRGVRAFESAGDHFETGRNRDVQIGRVAIDRVIVDRKPARWIREVGELVLNVSKLDAIHRRLFLAREPAIVAEGNGGRFPFCQWSREGELYGEVLRGAGCRDLPAGFVHDSRNIQRIVQLKRNGRNVVVQRNKADLRVGCQGLRMRVYVSVNDGVLYVNARALATLVLRHQQ